MKVLCFSTVGKNGKRLPKYVTVSEVLNFATWSEGWHHIDRCPNGHAIKR